MNGLRTAAMQMRKRVQRRVTCSPTETAELTE